MAITPSFLSHTRHNHDRWQETLEQGGCFILAEAAINQAVPWLAERWGKSLEQTRLYWGETGRVHASISPYCISVNAENWPAILEQLITQNGWGIGIQLAGMMKMMPPLDQLQALQKHLRQWSLVVMPPDENAILRIGDWQVVSRLMSASTIQEATAFYGPISAFWCIAPDGSAESLSLAQRESPTLPATTPRKLSDAQWAALLGPAEQHALARYMAHLREYHARWHDIKYEQLLAFTQAQCSAARRHGFNNERDIMRYLALATELEPAFIDAPWAQAILSQPDYIGSQSRMDRLYQQAIERLEDL